MAKITVKRGGTLSSNLGAELKKRRDLFKEPIGAKILIPTGGTNPTINALEWVLWHEFGTATKVKSAPEFGIVAADTDEYEIPSKGNPDSPLSMRFPPYKGRTYGFKLLKGRLITPKGYIITHPGYPPKRFIRKALADVKKFLRINLANAVAKGISGESDFTALENATLEEMQKVKTLIVKQMRSAFAPNTRPDGRLGGRSPAGVFQQAAVVVGVNTQSFDNIVTGDSHIANRPHRSRIKETKLAKFVAKSASKKLTPKDKGFLTAPLSKVNLRFKHPLISRITFKTQLRTKPKR